MSSRLLRALVVVLVTLATTGIALAASANRAEAADGFTLSSHTTYRVDENAPAVWVEMSYAMTNTKPDRNVDGGVRYYYFTGITVPIDTAFADLTVQVNGREVEYSTSEQEGDYTWLEITFNSNLRYQRTADIDVRYRFAADPPRTFQSYVRVNPAYVSFPVVAYGDEGLASVTVDVPSTWVAEYIGSSLSYRQAGGRDLYEAIDIESPIEFSVLLTARDDDRLDSTPVTTGTSRFEVRSWPGDTEWQAFTVRSVAEGVPVLERITGTPWPESNETDVIETSTPYLRGYAGYYYADTDVIEVGEELDRHTMLHELSHAWFNHTTIAQRWLSEGLADEIGARAVAELGERLPEPSDYNDVDSMAAAAGLDFPLNEWGEPFGDDTDGIEFYGYKTSFEVLRALRDEIGEQRMAALLTTVLDGRRAYPDEQGESPESGTIDWREFLDLAEQIGGSTELVDTYRDDVVTDIQLEMLDDRDGAVERFEQLVERGEGWHPPESVRRRMAQWGFELADEQMDAAEGVLDQRDRLADVLSAVDLSPTHAIQERYEQAGQLEQVAVEFGDQIAAAERLVASHAELTDQLTLLELDVPTLSQDDYESEPIGMASDTEALAERAIDLVEADTALDTTLAEFGLSTPALHEASFTDSPEDAQALVDDYQAAADVVVLAHRERESAGSMLERIGKVGSGADQQLEVADAELAAGNTDAAIAAARSADRRVDNWDERGRTRLLIAGGAVLALLVAVLVWRIVRRRRRHRQPDSTPDDVAVVIADETSDEAGDDANAEQVPAVDS